jgi:Fe-S-cluster containining protein
MSKVPCKGCKACCTGGQLIPLMPHEVERYSAMDSDYGTVLQHMPNGDCVCLGKKGCKIYNRRPSICQEYDCRVQYLAWSEELRKMGSAAIWEAAVERIHTLTKEEHATALAMRRG